MPRVPKGNGGAISDASTNEVLEARVRSLEHVATALKIVGTLLGIGILGLFLYAVQGVQAAKSAAKDAAEASAAEVGKASADAISSLRAVGKETEATLGTKLREAFDTTDCEELRGADCNSAFSISCKPGYFMKEVRSSGGTNACIGVVTCCRPRRK